MKLIIDVPDEEYKTLSKLSEKEKVNELSYYERIIANGIPLPRIYKCPKCLYLFNGKYDPNKCPRCGAKIKQGGAE